VKTLQEQIAQARRIIDDTEHVVPIVRAAALATILQPLNNRLYAAFVNGLRRNYASSSAGHFTTADYQLALTEAALELEGKSSNGAC
jgi:hypothetical protein